MRTLVGHRYVRSAAYSHTLGASLVYGYIDLDCHGTALVAEEGGAETPVKVSTLTSRSDRCMR